MRKNRRDPTDREQDRLYANPGGFTRAARRSAGYRAPVSLMGPEHEGLVVTQEVMLPRYVRRHGVPAMTGDKSRRRTHRLRTRVDRALRPWRMEVV